MLGGVWEIGDVRVTEIVELTTTSAAHWLLPDATAERIREIDWMVPDYATPDGKVHMTIRALVVEDEGRRIVVDTCLGNDKQRPVESWSMRSGPFLDDLTAAGFAPDTIDTVLCTHLHVDHVGWNTRLVDGRWQPTFRNARYLFAEAEWAHWRHEPQEYGPVIQDSVAPIFDSGLADVVAQDHRVNDEIRLEPTPGHTPGHVSVHITSRGEEAVITGDMIHHPCQIAHPDWSSTADFDRHQSASTRTDFLTRYADRPVLVIGTHFAAPTAGRIVRDGAAFRLDY